MKKYKIAELAEILGISYVAVKKKIKPDENNPDILRYKNRYDVVNETVKGRNISFILLDDEGLQNEIKETNTNKTVYLNPQNVNETVNNTVDYIDAEPIYDKNSTSEILEFSRDFLNRFETLMKMFNEQNKRLYLLEDSESRIKKELNQKNSEIIELTENIKIKDEELASKKRHSDFIIRIMSILLTVLSTLSLTLIVLFVYR